MATSNSSSPPKPAPTAHRLPPVTCSQCGAQVEEPAPAEARYSTCAACLSAPPQALPEAPASATLRLDYRGHDLLFTLRDHDGRSVLARLDAALDYLDTHDSTPAVPTAPRAIANGAAPICPTHGQPLLPSKRGTGYYCPAVVEDDGTGKPAYCRHKASAVAA